MTKVIALIILGLQPSNNNLIGQLGGTFPTMDACEARIESVHKDMVKAGIDPKRLTYRCLEVTFAIKLASY